MKLLKSFSRFSVISRPFSGLHGSENNYRPPKAIHLSTFFESKSPKRLEAQTQPSLFRLTSQTKHTSYRYSDKPFLVKIFSFPSPGGLYWPGKNIYRFFLARQFFRFIGSVSPKCLHSPLSFSNWILSYLGQSHVNFCRSSMAKPVAGVPILRPTVFCSYSFTYISKKFWRSSLARQFFGFIGSVSPNCLHCPYSFHIEYSRYLSWDPRFAF